jgi:ABC-type multidrug transport system fused ATPase/permease subunit
LARALVTKPKFLVLDEATSALDASTEVDIVSAINSLRGEVTVLIVAHRLSSVRSADQVIYMDKGSVTATGTFEEVRNKIPDFDLQSKLMGL